MKPVLFSQYQSKWNASKIILASFKATYKYLSVFNVSFFQLDNQLSGAVFRTVLAPIPPPKSVAADSGKFFVYC